MSQISPELCKLESSNMVYICRMSDCIEGLRLRVMACIFLFLSIFLSFPILHVHIKNFYVGVFSGTFKARILKLGILGFLALVFPFICPFFCLLRLNLCHSFLRNCVSQNLQMWYTYVE